MRRLITVISVAALVAATAATASANPWETEDIFGQGPAGAVVAVDGAKINRGPTGITASVTMPTPEPGSYTYPSGPTASGEPGHPEAFSLWVFLFFNPEACAGGPGNCGPADLRLDEDVVAGAFNAGGHLTAGPKLTISGRVTANSPSFGNDLGNAETIAEALALGYKIADAEVHIAIAPHGALAPELLPAQIKTPAGGPNEWWLAIYK